MQFYGVAFVLFLQLLRKTLKEVQKNRKHWASQNDTLPLEEEDIDLEVLCQTIYNSTFVKQLSNIYCQP